LFAYGATRTGRGQGLRTFGAGWFIAAYLPISNLVQLNATVAEHWLYLPMVGFLIFLFGLMIDFPPSYRRLMVAFALVSAAGLSVRSLFRSSDWADGEIFYHRILSAD